MLRRATAALAVLLVAGFPIAACFSGPSALPARLPVRRVLSCGQRRLREGGRAGVARLRMGSGDQAAREQAKVQGLFEADIEERSGGIMNNTPLHVACHAGKRDDVLLLLKGGASTEAQALSGSTPLILAAVMGHADIVRDLVDSGADLQGRDDFGNTALHKATAMGHREICWDLVCAGADQGAENKDGQTPYDSARNEIKALLQVWEDPENSPEGLGR